MTPPVHVRTHQVIPTRLHLVPLRVLLVQTQLDVHVINSLFKKYRVGGELPIARLIRTEPIIMPGKSANILIQRRLFYTEWRVFDHEDFLSGTVSACDFPIVGTQRSIFLQATTIGRVGEFDLPMPSDQ